MVANTIAPFGLRSFGHRDGSPPTMGLERRFVLSSDTSPIFSGDLVQNSTSVYGCITAAASGIGSSSVYNYSGYAGVFAGCEYYNATVNRQVWSPYFPGSVGVTSASVIGYIISDPDMCFIAQASSASVVGTSIIGWNIGVLTAGVSSLGNTTTGISNVSLASSLTIGSTGLLPFRVVDVYSNFAPPGTNGTDNTTAGAILVVQANNIDRNTLTGVST
jgi:hypothetical protein